MEDGYRFYFEHRTSLERHSDADQEETLLKLISNTFPNVFCNVRADLHARVASAEAVGTPNGFGEDDRTLLLAMINSRDAPERPPLTANVDFPWSKPATAEKCPPLDALSRAAASHAVSAAAPIVPEAPAPAQKSADVEKAPAPSAAAGVLAQQPDLAPPQSLQAAAEGLRAKARAFSQTADPRLFRVFFHVTSSGGRDPGIFDPLRAPLAVNGFRAMRGVEQVAAAPKQPQVRYFGPDEEGRAAELAAMLNEYFAAEGLSFKTVAIGDQFPDLPRTTLEVWLPDPAAGKTASLPPRPDLVGPDLRPASRPGL